MDFRIDATLPATAAQLWAIFFDVQRVAGLIPGCENVVEVEPLQEFSAVMKQKIGPFKLEVPTRILVDSHTVERQVVLVADGSDKYTGTTLGVRMKVDLEELGGSHAAVCRLAVDASMQVAGRLASLGYPIVKKRSEDLFSEFERRLRLELSGLGDSQSQATDGVDKAPPAKTQPSGPAPAQASAAAVDRQAPPEPRQVPVPASTPQRQASLPNVAPSSGRVELVLVWPRVGISLGVGLAVAHAAVAFGQSPWWWVAAPLLGMAAGLGRREA